MLIELRKNFLWFFLPFLLLVIGAFAFGSYLLYEKNEESFKYKRAFSEEIFKKSDFKDENYLENQAYKDILKEYKTARTALIIQIIVLGGFLVIGFVIVYRNLRKEILLARQQRNFILSITHELKSPIAAIQLVLETFIRRELTREQILKLSNNALRENVRLHDLVQNILMAARIEGQAEFDHSPIDFKMMVYEIVEKYKEQRPSIKFNFEADEEDIIYINGDRGLLSSVIHNLIENAIKYASKQPIIDIRLSKNKDLLMFEVADYGLGIPNEEKIRVFEKFYRIGNEETRHTKGTGLGLYITEQIVRIHKGTIQIVDNKPQGAVFQVSLPVSKEAVA